MTAIVAAELERWRTDPTLPTAPADVIAEAAKRYGFEPVDVKGPRRFRALVRARQLVAVRLEALGWSLSQIGAVLGRRDHSTVFWLLRGGRRVPPVDATPAA
jgi:chromosomal replication initiation ATPase DnaA